MRCYDNQLLPYMACAIITNTNIYCRCYNNQYHTLHERNTKSREEHHSDPFIKMQPAGVVELGSVGRSHQATAILCSSRFPPFFFGIWGPLSRAVWGWGVFLFLFLFLFLLEGGRDADY